MSTTQELKVLVIEDDKDAIGNYRARFRLMGLAMPDVVSSFNEAASALSSAMQFDLVILDLSIPEEPGAPEALDYGFVLLQQCIERDEHPIPGLIIITGHLEQTAQSAEREKLEREFACGRLVLKSPSNMSREIEPVIQQVRAFKFKTISGEHITSRENYLVRRLALEIGYQGFQVSLPTEQPTDLQGSPFVVDGAKIFIGTPILESGAQSPHRYYLVFSSADRYRLDSTLEQAKQWAGTCLNAPMAKPLQSNATALFFFPVANLIMAQSDCDRTSGVARSSKPTRGALRARACDLVFACIGGRTSIATLISDLAAQCDPVFQELDEEYVRGVLEQKRTNSTTGWAKVAELTMRVGAFGEPPSSEGDSDRRDVLANTFRQNHGNHKKRFG